MMSCTLIELKCEKKKLQLQRYQKSIRETKTRIKNVCGAFDK
jgi:hypothetical protein